jgi:cellulose synthase/poly-beta-1,6-N-acetylglucosamine synthase-like glycosyltransferase
MAYCRSSLVTKAKGIIMKAPWVTIIIPIRNEEDYIAKCLDSILANDYLQDRLEILLIDGMSTDRSREIVQDYIKRFPFIRLLENPKRIQAAALNIGLQGAKGEIIIRMDAHTLYAPDYISRCVELLETTEAANVGGLQRAVGTDYISSAIAVAITTPFGIGDAYFRYVEKEMWVDTVYLGAWRKSTLEELGGFNEEWAVNEDYELNYRLRKAGGKILLSPKIKCWYYVRPSLKALARQYFRYGFWRAKTLITYPDSLRWRQLAPPALVIALLLSLGILPMNWVLGITAPALYLVANLLASTWTASRKGWKFLSLLPFVFATIHLSWGIGFLIGFFRWGIPRIITWGVKTVETPG